MRTGRDLLLSRVCQKITMEGTGEGAGLQRTATAWLDKYDEDADRPEEAGCTRHSDQGSNGCGRGARREMWDNVATLNLSLKNDDKVDISAEWETILGRDSSESNSEISASHETLAVVGDAEKAMNAEDMRCSSNCVERIQTWMVADVYGGDGPFFKRVSAQDIGQSGVVGQRAVVWGRLLMLGTLCSYGGAIIVSVCKEKNKRRSWYLWELTPWVHVLWVAVMGALVMASCCGQLSTKCMNCGERRIRKRSKSYIWMLVTIGVQSACCFSLSELVWLFVLHWAPNAFGTASLTMRLNGIHAGERFVLASVCAVEMILGMVPLRMSYIVFPVGISFFWKVMRGDEIVWGVIVYSVVVLKCAAFVVLVNNLLISVL